MKQAAHTPVTESNSDLLTGPRNASTGTKASHTDRSPGHSDLDSSVRVCRARTRCAASTGIALRLAEVATGQGRRVTTVPRACAQDPSSGPREHGEWPGRLSCGRGAHRPFGGRFPTRCPRRSGPPRSGATESQAGAAVHWASGRPPAITREPRGPPDAARDRQPAPGTLPPGDGPRRCVESERHPARSRVVTVESGPCVHFPAHAPWKPVFPGDEAPRPGSCPKDAALTSPPGERPGGRWPGRIRSAPVSA